MRQVRKISERTEQSEHLYGECEYSARSWDTARRVVIKAAGSLPEETKAKRQRPVCRDQSDDIAEAYL